jgi:hypothetical protein
MFHTSVIQKIKTCPTTFFSENYAVYETLSKNIVEPEGPQETIWRRVACWISEAICTKAHGRVHALTPTHMHALTLKRACANTHAQKYVIFIAFSRQQLLFERASVLRYAYIACLVVL